MKPPDPDVVVAIAIALSMLEQPSELERIDSPWKSAAFLDLGDDYNEVERIVMEPGRRWALAGRFGV